VRSARFLPFALFVCFFSLAARVDSRELTKMLAEAERIHATDEPKSREMLDAVHRALPESGDPLLIAQAQLLECKWAAPPAAYRALAIGLPAAERAKSVVLKAKLIVCRANALQSEGNATQAERDYTTAVTLARQAREGTVEAEALEELGFLQYTRGAMADALTNAQAAYRINTRLGDEKGRLDTLALIAHVYADAKVAQYDRAIEYYKQLVVEYEKHGLPIDVADTLYNIASTLETQGNYAAAEFHYRRALGAFEKLQRPGDIAYTQRSLGSALMKQGRAKEALSYFDAALAFYEKERDSGNVAFVKQFRGSAYRRLGLADKALQDLAVARRYYERENNTRFLEKNTEEAALVYEQLGDWWNAYEFRKRNAALGQELAASRRDELSSRLRVEFDTEKKEQENRALARENTLRAAALREAQRNQKLQRAVIALTALLAIALAVLFWRQLANTRRQRAMAMTDELTRLPNRRHILAVTETTFAAAKRDGHSVAVIILDIDGFKRINDTYGHAAGDEVLKTVARTCRLTLRPADQIGRIGGEEFLIVVHPATSAQATDIAERLRTAVERLELTAIADALRVTISLGVWLTNEYDVSAAIAMADSLLYRSKENGRNRVEMAVAATAAP
jgi:diguanylate cyclase (GGDEF)-like protein